MICYKYYRNTLDDIKKLKKNLMSTPNKTESDISSSRQAFNEQVGKIFEKNIRYTLEYNFDFKKVQFPSLMFTKKIIIFENNKKIEEIELFQNEETEVSIKAIKYIIIFDKHFNLLIKNTQNKKIQEIGSINSNRETKIDLEGNKLTICPYKEMEIDGYFEMKNFSVNIFDKNEVEILFSNVNKEEEKNFVNSIIEVKLGANKADELIRQIRKDHHFLKLKKKNNTVVLGFINNSDNIRNKNHFNTLKNKKCVIFGIKNSILCGKEITLPIDWDVEKKCKNLSKDVKEVKKMIDNVNKRIDNVDKRIDNVEKKIECFSEEFGQKINKIYNYLFKEEKKEAVQKITEKENEKEINVEKKKEESKKKKI